MKRSLIDRLDRSLLKHTIDAGTKEGGPDILDVYKLQEMSEVHYYLKTEHNFSTAEIVALMQFSDPLEVAVACWEERGSPDIFPICDLLEQINAHEHYPTRYLPNQDMITAVKAVLDQNMSEYQASLLRLEKPELIAKSAEIAAMQEAYDFMKDDFKFQRGDAEALLRMENPLRFVADHWPSDIGGLFDLNDLMGEVIDEAAKTVAPQRGENPPTQEKPSIRGQLRDAARDTGQRQPPEVKPKGGDAR